MPAHVRAGTNPGAAHVQGHRGRVERSPQDDLRSRPAAEARPSRGLRQAQPTDPSGQPLGHLFAMGVVTAARPEAGRRGWLRERAHHVRGVRRGASRRQLAVSARRRALRVAQRLPARPCPRTRTRHEPSEARAVVTSADTSRQAVGRESGRPSERCAPLGPGSVSDRRAPESRATRPAPAGPPRTTSTAASSRSGSSRGRGSRG